MPRRVPLGPTEDCVTADAPPDHMSARAQTVRLNPSQHRILAGFAAKGFKTAPFDFDDAVGMEKALKGHDTLLLISGDGPTEARTAQHVAAIGAAKAAGVKRISVGSALARAAFGAFVRASLEIRDKGSFQFAQKAIGFTELEAFFTPVNRG